MRPRSLVVWLTLTFGTGLGCGDTNLFENFADDTSRQARLEKAQHALDKGDCETAVRLFTELQSADQGNVDLRIDLAAAYLCRAGFNVTTLVSIAADFGAGTVSDTELFQVIADKAVASISTTWPEDLDAAVALLAQDPSIHPPVAFQNDADAGFSLAIVNLAQMVLTLVDILNYLNGVVDCAAQQGSAVFQNCQISSDNVLEVVTGLQDSSDILTNLGLSSDVTDSVNTVLTDLNSVDGNTTNTVTCQDLTQYLTNQVIDTTQVSCVP